MATRYAIQDFALANPLYIGARVTFYQVDVNGALVDTPIPLYDDFTGTGTLANPQRLDSFGKNAQPIYADQATIAVISGLSIPTHQTGVIRSLVGTPSYRGALVTMSADLVNPAYPVTMAFNTESRDTDSIHDNVTNNSRLTVPTAASVVRCKARVTWTTTIAADSGVALSIYKNGTLAYTGAGKAVQGKAFYGNPSIEAETADIDVVPGDYFECVADTSDATSTIDRTATWFQMEVVK